MSHRHGEDENQTEPALVLRRFGWLTWRVIRSRLNERVEAVLRDPERFLTQSPHRFKNGRSSVVAGGNGMVLKRPKLRKCRNLIVDVFRRSRARKAFERAHELELLGIPSARVIATAEQRRFGFLIRSYFLMEEIPEAVKLRAWKGDKVQALHRVAALLAKLHQSGYTHRDLKDGNIVFDAKGGPHLLDLDGLRHVGHVPHDKAAANLARLARIALVLPRQNRRSGFGPILSVGQRLRFLKSYCEKRGLTDWRWWWMRIDQIIEP